MTAVDTAADASEADVSALVIDVDVADRSELRVVRLPRALDSTAFWFVRSVSAVPAAGRFPIPRAFSSASTSPTESLIDVPSVSRPPTRPDAPCTAPSRVPAFADTPARALAAFDDRPSRAPPIWLEKDASEVRESLTSWSAWSKDVDSSEAAASRSLRVARAEATDAFAASILSPMPSRVCEALPSLAEASDTDADTSDRFWSASFAIPTPTSDAFSESTLATVETNAELICRSRDVAPAPVILGATALFFSLT